MKASNSKFLAMMASMRALMAKGFKPETFGLKSSMFNSAPTFETRSRPGRSRNRKPNPARRATKTLNGTIFHRSEPRGYSFGHETVAPTLDQTRALETRIGMKVRVRDGQCYAGQSGFRIPINATLEEATKLLDAYILADCV